MTETKSTTASPDQLKQLEGKISIQFSPDLPQTDSGVGRPGEFIAAGEGTFKSDQLEGSVRVEFFEAQSELKCDASFVGSIKTTEGTEIAFETRGFLYLPDRNNQNDWRTRSEVSFETTDDRYAWLNDAVGSWDGTSDLDTYQHEATISAWRAE